MSQNKTICISICGGRLTDVENLPVGWDYDLLTYNNIEDERRLYEVVLHYQCGETEYCETDLYEATLSQLEQEVHRCLIEFTGTDEPVVWTFDDQNATATDQKIDDLERLVWATARRIDAIPMPIVRRL